MKHAHACRRPLWRVKPQGGAVQLVPRSAVIHDEVVGCALEVGVQHADLIESGGEAAKLNDYKLLCSQHMSPSMHPYYITCMGPTRIMLASVAQGMNVILNSSSFFSACFTSRTMFSALSTSTPSCFCQEKNKTNEWTYQKAHVIVLTCESGMTWPHAADAI